jgi:hypothetical protein
MRTTILSALRLDVRSLAGTNDHEVRPMIDGEDLIATRFPGLVGVDPDDLLIAPSPLRPGAPHAVTVARCECGEAGCSRGDLSVRTDGDQVSWLIGARTYRFERGRYLAEIARAEQDTRWETPDRTAARLIRDGVDRRTLAMQGLGYQWSSGRLSRDHLAISLRVDPGPYQALVWVPWTGGASASAMAAEALLVLALPPATWNAHYHPLAHGLGQPAIAGPNWRRAQAA